MTDFPAFDFRICRGSGCFPFADQPKLPVDGDVGFVAKERDGEIRCGDRPVILPFCFREFQRPARKTVLVG